MIPAALLGYFAIVLLVSWAKPVEVRSQWVQLLRMLLPSWRFFEELGDVPRLEFREGSDDSLGPWQPVIVPLRRSMRRLVYNPDGNLALACESLLQQLIGDVADLAQPTSDVVAGLVSYRLTRNLVEQRIAKDASAYQFQVVLGGEDVIVSAVHAC